MSSHPPSHLHALASFLARGCGQLAADLFDRTPGRRAHDGPARAEAVATRLDLPEGPVDVAIVGAGIVGTCIALTLAERGLRVALFDKGQVAGEASSRAFGWVTDLFEDAAKLPLSTRSKRLWAGMNERLGADTGFRPRDTLFLCRSTAELEAATAWSAVARQAGAQPRILDRTALQARLGDAGEWLGAMALDGEGSIDARHATAPIARRAQALGVHIAAPCAVRALATEGRRVTGVHTEHGLCRAAHVVVAGGVWSSLLASLHGLHLPTVPLFLSNQALRLRPHTGPRESLFTPDIDWWLGDDGLCRIGHPMMTVPVTAALLRRAPRYLALIAAIGQDVKMQLRWGAGRQWLAEGDRPDPQRPSPFERCRVLSPEPDRRGLDGVLARFVRQFPDCAGAAVVDRWAGAVALTPDALPCLGAAPGWQGLHLATGFTAGLTQAPAAAESLVQAMFGEPTAVDLRPFDPARFTRP
jgi:glycine/D-amino acid oxidase-like deaminating enzyme